MGYTSFECRLCGGPGRKGIDDAGETIIEHDCRETLRVPCNPNGREVSFANVKPLIFLRIIGQDFFIHKGVGIVSDLFVLSEYTTGRKVEMRGSLGIILGHARGRLEKMGQQEVLRKITAAILETGMVNKPERLRPEKTEGGGHASAL